MRPHHTRACLLVASAMTCLLSNAAAQAQVNTRTYGPGLSFGQYGTLTNYRERQNFGYGYGYGYGSGVGPVGVFGAPFGNPAFIDPRAAAVYGYTLPYASPSYFYQNPATFPPGSPNYDSYSRGYVPPTSSPGRPRLFWRGR